MTRDASAQRMGADTPSAHTAECANPITPPSPKTRSTPETRAVLAKGPSVVTEEQFEELEQGLDAAVLDAVVVLNGEAGGENRLVAYWIARPRSGSSRSSGAARNAHSQAEGWNVAGPPKLSTVVPASRAIAWRCAVGSAMNT